MPGELEPQPWRALLDAMHADVEPSEFTDARIRAYARKAIDARRPSTSRWLAVAASLVAVAGLSTLVLNGSFQRSDTVLPADAGAVPPAIERVELRFPHGDAALDRANGKALAALADRWDLCGGTATVHARGGGPAALAAGRLASVTHALSAAAKCPVHVTGTDASGAKDRMIVEVKG